MLFPPPRPLSPDPEPSPAPLPLSEGAAAAAPPPELALSMPNLFDTESLSLASCFCLSWFCLSVKISARLLLGSTRSGFTNLPSFPSCVLLPS